MMDKQVKGKLSELIVCSFEGLLTDQQKQELNEIVSSSPEAAQWYIEFMDMLSCFTEYGTTDIKGFESEYNIIPDLPSPLNDVYPAVFDSNVSLEGVRTDRLGLDDTEAEDTDDSALTQETPTPCRPPETL